MTVIAGFLSSIGFVLLAGFGWLYLCRMLLRVLEVKSPPRGPVTQQQGRRGKARMAFRLLVVVSSFLIIGSVISFFLLPYTTYLVVGWVILIILFSNILNQELRVYYHIGLEQVLTTLHLTAVKMVRSKRPRPIESAPDLRAITDTTAYLNVLRQSFKPGGKKGTGRDDPHK